MELDLVVAALLGEPQDGRDRLRGGFRIELELDRAPGGVQPEHGAWPLAPQKLPVDRARGRRRRRRGNGRAGRLQRLAHGGDRLVVGGSFETGVHRFEEGHGAERHERGVGQHGSHRGHGRGIARPQPAVEHRVVDLGRDLLGADAARPPLRERLQRRDADPRLRPGGGVLEDEVRLVSVPPTQRAQPGGVGGDVPRRVAVEPQEPQDNEARVTGLRDGRQELDRDLPWMGARHDPPPDLGLDVGIERILRRQRAGGLDRHVHPRLVQRPHEARGHERVAGEARQRARRGDPRPPVGRAFEPGQ